jgi:microcompartment protein CcmK/EutM
MSLATNVTNLATRVATEIKTLRTLINGNAADNTALITTAKGNLVAAINEVALATQNASGINDTATSTSTAWSSSKTNTEIQNRVAALVASAPTTLDTLDELAAALGDDPNFGATITTALGNRVRFDAVQTLTGAQQQQARDNIAAGTSNLVLGTTGTTAMPGNKTFTYTDVGAAPASHTHTAANISDASTIGRSILTAADAASVRSLTGAGTSNLVIGTTSTTAKAGDYAPPAASTTVAGTVTLATSTEATTGTDTVKAITSATLKAVGDTKAPLSHTHTASQISDASTVGRSLVTATDAATARTAIGAGTSNLVIGTTSSTAKAGDYTPPTASDIAVGLVELATTTEATTGTDTARAVTPAGLKAVADTKAALSHTHVATDISNSTAVGRSLITALDAPTARSAIGAGTSNLVIGTASGTAADAALVGDTTVDFVATFNAGLV